MKIEAEEHFKELEAKYPTVESMVDDYREGLVGSSTVAYRFPEAQDKEELQRLAAERNAADGLN